MRQYLQMNYVAIFLLGLDDDIALRWAVLKMLSIKMTLRTN